MDARENQLPRGLKYSLHFLGFLAYPILIVGLMGLVLMPVFSLTVRKLSDFIDYYEVLGFVLLIFITGRGLLLLKEFIFKSHTEQMRENLVLKYSLLLLKEVTFIIAFVLIVASAILIALILMDHSRDYRYFLLFFTLPAIIAGFINYKISDKMKCFEGDPIAY